MSLSAIIFVEVYRTFALIGNPVNFPEKCPALLSLGNPWKIPDVCRFLYGNKCWGEQCWLVSELTKWSCRHLHYTLHIGQLLHARFKFGVRTLINLHI